MKILLVDNKDSFTYNIAHSIRLHPGVNLQIIDAENVTRTNLEPFDKIIFSPGPDLPRPGNAMELLLKEYSGRKPILGICLGLQAVYLFYGGTLKRLQEPVHGKKRTIIKTGEKCKILKDLPERFEAGLYHSWIADENNLPGTLVVTAFSEEGRIMAVRHKTLDIEAVQFHPESILTQLGNKMIGSWMNQ